MHIAQNNLGNTYLRQGRLDEAAACYREALRINAGFAEAYHGLGNVLERQNRLDEAMDCYQRGLRLKPHLAEAHNNVGNIFTRQKMPEKAIGCYQQAIRLDPNLVKAHNNLGIALTQMARLDEAAVCFRTAVRLLPNSAEIHTNLANALKDSGLYSEAISSYRAALGLNPDVAEAYNGLGSALANQDQLDEAIHCFHTAVDLKPDFADAHNNLGCAFICQCRLDLAMTSWQSALRIQPDLSIAHSNLVSAMNYDQYAQPDAVFAEHCQWGRAQEQAANRLPHSNDPAPERRLRIGYVSPDLRCHPLARYFEPVLAHHDSEQVHTFCYAEIRRPDEVTARLQKHAHEWRWTCGLTDDQVTEQIRRDKIDILVDLAGLTRDTRLPVFARKPAPVQAAWLGYMNTTGLTTMDYRLTDEVLDPLDQPVRDTEELWRLPGGACCFAPPSDAPPVRPLPALARGFLTFGSLNNPIKINDAVLDLWALVLKDQSTAHLLIYHDKLTDRLQERLRDKLAERGIDGMRVELRRGTTIAADYLRVYSEFDVALDTFPCTGGVTTCEALWMGVPVVSLCGVRPASRNSAALLTRVGLADWIAKTPEQYIAVARSQQGNLDALATLRSTLRERTAGTLCEARRFTRALEDAYRTMWRRWCQKVSPASQSE